MIKTLFGNADWHSFGAVLLSIGLAAIAGITAVLVWITGANLVRWLT